MTAQRRLLVVLVAVCSTAIFTATVGTTERTAQVQALERDGRTTNYRRQRDAARRRRERREQRQRRQQEEASADKDDYKGNVDKTVLETFEMTHNLSAFDPNPNEEEIHRIAGFLPDADLDARFVWRKPELLTKERLAAAIDHIESEYQKYSSKRSAAMTQYKLRLRADDAVRIFGKDIIRWLVKYMRAFVGNKEQPVREIFYQRFEHYNTTVSPYHTDGVSYSLIILLNDDYQGGDMTFLTRSGPMILKTEAGVASIHGPGVVHGNAAVNGVKHQLTFLTHSNATRRCVFSRLRDFSVDNDYSEFQDIYDEPNNNKHHRIDEDIRVAGTVQGSAAIVTDEL